MTGLKKCGLCNRRVARMYYELPTGGVVFICVGCSDRKGKHLHTVGRVLKKLGGSSDADE